MGLIDLFRYEVGGLLMSGSETEGHGKWFGVVHALCRGILRQSTAVS